MSFLARNVLRSTLRATRATKSRAYSAAQGSGSFAAEQAAIEHHAAGTTDLWRKISFYGCFPAVAVCVAWVYNAEAEHAAHEEHLKAENSGHLPEVPAFEYMNRRVKPFPWGMNSLFYNPHTNKDMEAEA
ncbi:X15341 cytochrome C oxidase subunit [Pleurotus eryngii]|uniref:X15341 cytochrome C oxidase subunit n=1 Tax=Pleurotus eryngii TaxID=5323 RepID=A0A9P5ZY30_PLEER|nr:X15341 cytochrome C oxidase subunit [Pleurotus eryngii]